MSNAHLENELKLAKILLEARIDAVQRSAHQSLFSGLFHTTKTVPVLELDGTPTHDIFTVLCLSAEYSDDQIQNIQTFSHLHRYLYNKLMQSDGGQISINHVFVDAIIRCCGRILHQFTNYANLDAQMEIELSADQNSSAKKNTTSLFPDSILSVRQNNMIQQKMAELPNYSNSSTTHSTANTMLLSPHTAVHGHQWTSESAEACATEAVRILSLLCVMIPTVARKTVPVLWKLRSPLWNLSLGTCLLSLALNATLEWGSTVLIESEDAVDAFIEEALSASFRRHVLAIHSWNLLLTHSRLLLTKSTIFSVRSPLILRTLGWHARLSLLAGGRKTSVATSLLPKLIPRDPLALVETFHTLLDLPACIALFELAILPNSESLTAFSQFSLRVQNRDYSSRSLNEEIAVLISYLMRDDSTYPSSYSSSINKQGGFNIHNEHFLKQSIGTEMGWISPWVCRPTGTRLRAVHDLMIMLCRCRVSQSPPRPSGFAEGPWGSRGYTSSSSHSPPSWKVPPSSNQGTCPTHPSIGYFDERVENELRMSTGSFSIPTRVSAACQVASVLLRTAVSVVLRDGNKQCLDTSLILILEVLCERIDLILPVSKFQTDVENILLKLVQSTAELRPYILIHPRASFFLQSVMLRTGRPAGGADNACSTIPGNLRDFVIGILSALLQTTSSNHAANKEDENLWESTKGSSALLGYLEVALTLLERVVFDCLNTVLAVMMGITSSSHIAGKNSNEDLQINYLLTPNDTSTEGKTPSVFNRSGRSNDKATASFYLNFGLDPKLKSFLERFKLPQKMNSVPVNLSNGADVYCGSAAGALEIDTLLIVLSHLGRLASSTMRQELKLGLLALQDVLKALIATLPFESNSSINCWDSRKVLLDRIDSVLLALGDELFVWGVDLNHAVEKSWQQAATNNQEGETSYLPVGWNVNNIDAVRFSHAGWTDRAVVEEVGEWLEWLEADPPV